MTSVQSHDFCSLRDSELAYCDIFSVLITSDTTQQDLNLVATLVSTTEFEVTWEDIDGDFEDFCVGYSPYEGQDNRQQESFRLTRSMLSAQFYGLDPGKEYTVSVETCNLDTPTQDGADSISFRLGENIIKQFCIASVCPPQNMPSKFWVSLAKGEKSY